MKHKFSVDVASEVGVNAAIVFENLCFWISLNERNSRNIKDGKCWTFSSVKGLAEHFPYMSERQVRNALDKLIESEFVCIGNYNKTAYDRTRWYSLTEKGISFFGIKNYDLPISSNGITKKVKPIPDRKTNKKQNYIKEDEQNFSVNPFAL